jgi:hypothetical protein
MKALNPGIDMDWLEVGPKGNFKLNGQIVSRGS